MNTKAIFCLFGLLLVSTASAQSLRVFRGVFRPRSVQGGSILGTLQVVQDDGTQVTTTDATVGDSSADPASLDAVEVAQGPESDAVLDTITTVPDVPVTEPIVVVAEGPVAEAAVTEPVVVVAEAPVAEATVTEPVVIAVAEAPVPSPVVEAVVSVAEAPVVSPVTVADVVSVADAPVSA